MQLRRTQEDERLMAELKMAREILENEEYKKEREKEYNCITAEQQLREFASKVDSLKKIEGGYVTDD